MTSYLVRKPEKSNQGTEVNTEMVKILTVSFDMQNLDMYIHIHTYIIPHTNTCIKVLNVGRARAGVDGQRRENQYRMT